jgi:hypothetical protein
VTYDKNRRIFNAAFLLLTLALIATRPVWLRTEVPIQVHARPSPATTTELQRSTSTSATTAQANGLPIMTTLDSISAKATNRFLVRQDLRWSQPIPEPLFARFAEWVEDYRHAGAAQKVILEAEGIVIARERRNAMHDLIQTNPARALELTVPLGVRRSVPGTVAEFLEERLSGRGSLDVFAALAEPGQEGKVTPAFRVATLQGRDYRAFVYGRRLGEPTRRNIPLNGVAVDDVFAVSENPLRLLESEELLEVASGREEPICAVSGNSTSIGETPVAADLGGSFKFFCAPAHAAQFNEQLIQAEVAGDGGGGEVQANARTEGTKRLLFIRVDFSDLPGAPFPDATGVNLISGLNDFFMEQSYGRSSFFLNAVGSEITPTLRMPQTASYYGGNNAYYQLRSDARAAAAAAGYVLSNYDYDLYCFGAVPGWYWAGLGYVGASGVWLRSYFTVGVAGHELGHNYGLNHANFWDTGDQGTANDDASVEYGDMFDTMGSANGGSYHFNARYKSYMNWLTSSETHTVSSSGTYRIFPHDDPVTTGLRGLRIVRSSTTNYWVEFRQRFTANKWLMNGAGIRWAGNGNERSHLLDATPGSPDGKIDSALVIGRTFSDRPAGIHVTALRKGGTVPESLDVAVNLGTFPGNLPPSIVVTPGATAANPGATVTFSATATDNDGDALAYYWDFGDGTFGTNGALAAKSWPAAGEYVVRCVASDMKGGIGSDSIVVTVGNPTTYRITGQVSANGSPAEGVRVAVSSVKVTYTDSDGTYTLAGLPAGSYTVSATLDGATFNTTGFANPVSVGPNASGVNFASSSGGAGVTNPASVTLTSPVNNATYSGPASVFLAASATPATGGSIAKVEFYQSATKLGEDASFPYSFTWNAAPVGNYSLTARAIQGSGTTVTSAPVAIYVTPTAPAIASQPQSQTVSAGGAAIFAVTVSGTSPFAYRWRFNGTDINGSGNASLSLFNVQIPQAGNYSVVISNAAGVVTSSVATLTVSCSYNLTANGRSFSASGSAGSVGVASQGSCSWSVANVPTWMTITSGNGGSGNGTVNYFVTTNSSGSSRSATLLIGGQSYTVTQSAPDLIPPTVAFTAPGANASFTNAQISVAGSADDNDAVWRVDVSVGSGTFAPASGTDSWIASVALAPGTNYIRVRSVDVSGNISATNTRSVFCAVPGTLSLVVNGKGHVKGATNGQSLHIGKICKLVAAPMAGFVFSNWTGDVSGDSPTLSFLMQSNLAVAANFVTNPFVPVKGVFNGLFHESNEVRVTSSGSFILKLTSKGNYTASLRLAGAKLRASGRFDLDGRASAIVPRTGSNPLTLSLAVDLSGSDRITGTVSDESWTAHLLGDRAAGGTTNPAAAPGKYTLILLGSPGTALAPGGDSYGTASIDSRGNIRVKGSLADKTVIASRTSLSRDGHWPLHIPLYAGKGGLLGWINFKSGPATDLDGVMSWIKPAISTAPFYPNGFTSEAALLGSRYVPPVGSTGRVLELTNTVVLFAGGNLMQSITNDVMLGPGSKIVNASPNPLVLKFTASSGMYKGTFLSPGAARPVSFKGVVLQKGKYGSGYFLGTDLSGWVGFGQGSLSPANPFEPASVR